MMGFCAIALKEDEKRVCERAFSILYHQPGDGQRQGKRKKKPKQNII